MKETNWNIPVSEPCHLLKQCNGAENHLPSYATVDRIYYHSIKSIDVWAFVSYNLGLWKAPLALSYDLWQTLMFH